MQERYLVTESALAPVVGLHPIILTVLLAAALLKLTLEILNVVPVAPVTHEIEILSPAVSLSEFVVSSK